MKSLERVRIGFIGAGGIAERHVGVLRDMPDVELAGFADADMARAEALASREDGDAFGSASELLERARPDAVYICVPPFAHGEIERQVIAAGVPFFVEKPLSIDLATAEEIAGEVERNGLVTGVGYHWRYLDTVEEAKRLLADRPAAMVAGHWLDQTPPPHWWRRHDQSGGQVIEQATHVIDLARHLVGEIVEVYAQGGTSAPRQDFDGLDIATSTAVCLSFASGAVGTLSATCMLRWGHRVGLHLFADGLAIELSDRDIMIDTGHGRPVRQAGRDPVEHEDRDFIDAVKGLPNRIRSPYAEALKSHRVALAISQSAATGKPIRLREIANA